MAFSKDYRSLIDAGLQKYLPNDSNMGNLLHKICIHPFLLPVFEEYATKDQIPEKVNELLFNSTPRYNYINKVLEKCREQQERLVVICSLNDALDLLADAIESK